MDIRAIRYSGRSPLRSTRGMLPSVIFVGSHRSGVNQDSVERPLQSSGRNCRIEERGDELHRGRCRTKMGLYSVLTKLHGLLKIEFKTVLVNVFEE